MNRDELTVALDAAYEAGYRAGLRREPQDSEPAPRTAHERRLVRAWNDGYAAGKAQGGVVCQRVRRG